MKVEKVRRRGAVGSRALQVGRKAALRQANALLGGEGRGSTATNASWQPHSGCQACHQRAARQLWETDRATTCALPCFACLASSDRVHAATGFLCLDRCQAVQGKTATTSSQRMGLPAWPAQTGWWRAAAAGRRPAPPCNTERGGGETPCGVTASHGGSSTCEACCWLPRNSNRTTTLQCRGEAGVWRWSGGEVEGRCCASRHITSASQRTAPALRDPRQPLAAPLGAEAQRLQRRHLGRLACLID